MRFKGGNELYFAMTCKGCECENDCHSLNYCLIQDCELDQVKTGFNNINVDDVVQKVIEGDILSMGE